MLQYLSLAYCTRLTEVCSTYFNQLECFKSLKYLDLSGCIQLTDIAIQYVSGVCHYLRFLDLCGCELITHKMVRLTTGRVEKVEYSTDSPPDDFLPSPTKETA
uniref:Uncharacterized protein n=1 Tax=Trichobilharzia regenti TaxID=157069 RepID=A0AA85JSX6_TRIRE|nr:unnamed protein product [Trichobilharzia regenti]